MNKCREKERCRAPEWDQLAVVQAGMELLHRGRATRAEIATGTVGDRLPFDSVLPSRIGLYCRRHSSENVVETGSNDCRQG